MLYNVENIALQSLQILYGLGAQKLVLIKLFLSAYFRLLYGAFAETIDQSRLRACAASHHVKAELKQWKRANISPLPKV